jgi:hypothetical protein
MNNVAPCHYLHKTKQQQKERGLGSSSSGRALTLQKKAPEMRAYFNKNII